MNAASLAALIWTTINRGEVRQLTVAPDAIRKHYRERECHANVASWVADHPGHRAVHGWLITGEVVFVLHAVVDTGAELLDITPRSGVDAASLLDFVLEERPIDGLPAQLIYAGR